MKRGTSGSVPTSRRLSTLIARARGTACGALAVAFLEWFDRSQNRDQAAGTAAPVSAAAGASITQRTDFEHGQAPPTRRGAGICDAAASAVTSPRLTLARAST